MLATQLTRPTLPMAAVRSVEAKLAKAGDILAGANIATAPGPELDHSASRAISHIQSAQVEAKEWSETGLAQAGRAVSTLSTARQVIKAYPSDFVEDVTAMFASAQQDILLMRSILHPLPEDPQDATYLRNSGISDPD